MNARLVYVSIATILVAACTSMGQDPSPAASEPITSAAASVPAAVSAGPSTSLQPDQTPVHTASPSAEPTSVQPDDPSTAPTHRSTLDLRRAPDNMGCDAIGLDYGSVTFRIRPEAKEQVVAVTDAGEAGWCTSSPGAGPRQLLTYWSPSFYATGKEEPLIRDGAGNAVVRDGDVLRVGETLRGYDVCASPCKLYVLDYAIE